MAAMGPARRRGAASAELLDLMMSMEKEGAFAGPPKTLTRSPQEPAGQYDLLVLEEDD